ncbi:PLDc N-terminal domain-containing protein [Microbacterium sp. NPDC007973]|uniref:PLDc N-terminal domain-containing protein n=1 Tax=Microbacterium sp. NPDC007973 TaxID=3364182 RepID=UPI0036E4E3A9
MIVTTLSSQIVLAVFALVYAASLLAAVVAVRDPHNGVGLKATWAVALLLLPPVGLVAWEASRIVDHRAVRAGHAAHV